MDIVHSYLAAMGGYHYYKHFWKPIENEQFCCLHEKFNFYDSFAADSTQEW